MTKKIIDIILITLIFLLPLILLSKSEGSDFANYQTPAAVTQLLAAYPITLEKGKNCKEIKNLKSVELNQIKRNFCSVKEKSTNHIKINCQDISKPIFFFTSTSFCQYYKNIH